MTNVTSLDDYRRRRDYAPAGRLECEHGLNGPCQDCGPGTRWSSEGAVREHPCGCVVMLYRDGSWTDSGCGLHLPHDSSEGGPE